MKRMARPVMRRSPPWAAPLCNLRQSMIEEIDRRRRRFFGGAAMTFAAAELGLTASEAARAAKAALPAVKPGANTSFASMKQIDASVLSVG